MPNKKSIDYKEETKDKFNKQAKKYDSTNYSKHARGLYDTVLIKLDQFSFNKLLDVGCGTGNLLALIFSKYDVQIAGVDLSPDMLEIARKKLGEKTDLRLGDSEYLPFDDESFDVVICTDSFHHYPHPKNALTEFRRVLHPKGRIIIADPYAPTPIRQIFNLIMPHTHEGDVKMYSEYNIRKLLENTGFNTIEWEKVGRTAFIVTASN
jgi:ubiquinone/menaquinone biosynthesis C-methylase UbiE